MKNQSRISRLFPGSCFTRPNNTANTGWFLLEPNLFYYLFAITVYFTSACVITSVRTGESIALQYFEIVGLLLLRGVYSQWFVALEESAILREYAMRILNVKAAQIANGAAVYVIARAPLIFRPWKKKECTF